MSNTTNQKLAFVTSVYPNKVKIEVENLTAFKDSVDEALGDLKIGSYLEISDNDGCKLIAIIESYQIELKERAIENEQGEKEREIYNAYILEASPLGTIKDDKFIRGGDALTIPPTEVKPASKASIKLIYENGFEPQEKFLFAKLAQDENVEVPVNGNKFFNKHFAIVGSSGSGKSHTVAKIVQKAIAEKNGTFKLNNSHIVIFDIHNEYKTAFTGANFLDIGNLVLPYWLLNSEELNDLFIESNEQNSHNQVSQFQFAVTENKKRHNPKVNQDKVYFDSPLKFDIREVVQYIKNINNEVIGRLDTEGVPKKSDGTLIHNRIDSYFTENITFCEQTTRAAEKSSGGPYKGDFERFILRLENTVGNKRFNFLFDDKSLELKDVLENFLGYSRKIKDNSGNETTADNSNVTIIDLSGVPFEVLSITVSLISRILFDYGYFYKKYLNDGIELETPLLLVYEEAHKYVPKNDSAKFRASRNAIERIAKEGRKYGVTLGIVSQRPSEISETIFSQCNNFIAMRLTNPTDQNYVKRLLPDTLGNLIDNLPSLQSGEGLLLGESIIMPSLVKIEKCDKDKQPSSNDVKYLETWKEKWKDVEFEKIIKKWKD